jgi:hypothetical protein
MGSTTELYTKARFIYICINFFFCSCCFYFETVSHYIVLNSWSSCLSLSNVRVIGACYHTWFPNSFLLSVCLSVYLSIYLSFFLFGGTGVWTQVFTLDRMALYLLSLQPFRSGYFWDRVSLFCLDCDSLILHLLQSLGWHMHASMPSYWLRWGLANFLSKLDSNRDSLDLRFPSS